MKTAPLRAMFPSPSLWQVGVQVWVETRDDSYWPWVPATIVGFDGERVEVAVEDSGEEATLDPSRLRLYQPIVEGTAVLGCYADDLEDCYDGKVLRVMPNGDVAILYEDGDWENRVTPFRYFVPPFAYAPYME